MSLKDNLLVLHSVPCHHPAGRDMEGQSGDVAWEDSYVGSPGLEEVSARSSAEKITQIQIQKCKYTNTYTKIHIHKHRFIYVQAASHISLHHRHPHGHHHHHHHCQEVQSRQYSSLSPLNRCDEKEDPRLCSAAPTSQPFTVHVASQPLALSPSQCSTAFSQPFSVLSQSLISYQRQAQTKAMRRPH